MSPLPVNFYARWLVQIRPVAGFRETDTPPPERWLQQIWRHQRLCRDRLTTLDGRPLRVLHPGFWNREPGPDFRDAVVQFADEPPRRGDIEIDLAPSGWRGHGHRGNAAYAQVVLHVVWDAAQAESPPPAFALKPFLDSPLAELAPWLSGEAPESFPEQVAGQCAGPLREVSTEVLAELLNQAARVRLERKAAELEARARHAGWEQALWEGLFAALGYKHNVWPMRRLAEIVAPISGGPASSRSNFLSAPSSVLAWQSRLLGLAGLLPVELPRRDASTQLRQLWDHWWRERDAFADVALPTKLWRLAGIRPANHPQRRLALAAHWLAGGGLARHLEAWLQTPASDATTPLNLLKLLQPGDEDTFWSHHWTLRSPRLPKAQPLLGAPRATDLAINVILPWLWARAQAGGDPTATTLIERRHFTWPAGEDNAVLKLARQRLFGGAARRLPRTAAAQQGLLQIVRDFCDHSNALCSGCRFPDLVRTLPK